MTKHVHIFDAFTPMVFELLARDIDKVSFIQVGACRGNDNDNIFNAVKKYNWKGILIEPHNGNYSKLKEDYSDFDDLEFLQCAVAAKDGFQEFYSIKDPDSYSSYADQVSSLIRDNVVSYLQTHCKLPISEANDAIIEEKMISRRLSTIVSECNVLPNIIYIDAEGYDYSAIKTIDFDKCLPEILYYEHGHLSDADCTSCHHFIISKGYKLIYGFNDAMAINDNYWEKRSVPILDGLKKMWYDDSEYPKHLEEHIIPFDLVVQMVNQESKILCSRFPADLNLLRNCLYSQ